MMTLATGFFLAPVLLADYTTAATELECLCDGVFPPVFKQNRAYCPFLNKTFLLINKIFRQI